MNTMDPADQDIAVRVARFSARAEVRWFGLQGSLAPDGWVCVSFVREQDGVLGGGGVDAINGGVVAASFDAACVLAGLVAYRRTDFYAGH